MEGPTGNHKTPDPETTQNPNISLLTKTLVTKLNLLPKIHLQIPDDVSSIIRRMLILTIILLEGSIPYSHKHSARQSRKQCENPSSEWHLLT